MSAAARPPEVIDLQRLHLRRPRLTDATAIFEYASDPEVARYADWPISKSIESVEEHLRLRETEWNSGAEFHWVVTSPPDDRAIGAIACTISGHAAEFGFLLARRFWRNGYATEAARAIVGVLGAVGVAPVSDLRRREPGVRPRAREMRARAGGHFAARDRSPEPVRRAA